LAKARLKHDAGRPGLDDPETVKFPDRILKKNPVKIPFFIRPANAFVTTNP